MTLEKKKVGQCAAPIGIPFHFFSKSFEAGNAWRCTARSSGDSFANWKGREPPAAINDGSCASTQLRISPAALQPSCASTQLRLLRRDQPARSQLYRRRSWQRKRHSGRPDFWLTNKRTLAPLEMLTTRYVLVKSAEYSQLHRVTKVTKIITMTRLQKLQTYTGTFFSKMITQFARFR